MAAKTGNVPTRALVLVFALALVVRVGSIWARGEYVTPAIPGAEAGVVAAAVAGGRGFETPFGGESPSTHLPPGYVLWLALLLAMGGKGFMFYGALAANVMASALLPAVTVKLAEAVGVGGRAAVAAGVLMCACPESLRAAGLIWDEAFFSLAFALMLWWMLRVIPRATYWSSSAIGGVAGVLSLVNPAGSLALPVAWLAGLGADRRVGWRVWAHGAIFVGMMVVGGLPWHVRNWVLLDPPARVFVRGNFWLEVWSTINPVVFHNGTPLVMHPWQANGLDGMVRDGRPLTEQEYFEWCKQRALAQLDSPPAWARHVGRQVNGYWFGVAEAQRWGRNPWVFFAAQGVPAIAGLMGWWIARKRVWPVGLAVVVAVLVVFPLAYYVSGGGARYRHPVDAILYIGIAAGVAAMCTSNREIVTPNDPPPVALPCGRST